MSEKGTKEIAAELGVTQDALTRWVRDGLIKAEVVGEKQRRRIQWDDISIAQAKALAAHPPAEARAKVDDGSEFLEHVGGSEFLDNYRRGLDRAGKSLAEEIVVVHEHGVRVFHPTSSLRDVAKATGGMSVIIPCLR